MLPNTDISLGARTGPKPPFKEEPVVTVEDKLHNVEYDVNTFKNIKFVKEVGTNPQKPGNQYITLRDVRLQKGCKLIIDPKCEVKSSTENVRVSLVNLPMLDTGQIKTEERLPQVRFFFQFFSLACIQRISSKGKEKISVGFKFH